MKILRRWLFLAAISGAAGLTLLGATAANADPTVTEVVLSPTAGAYRTYGVGDEIPFRLTFSESVELQGSDTATHSFEAPKVSGVASSRQTVSDPNGLSATDTVMVRARTARIALLESAANPVRESIVRVVNHSGEGGEVRIVAIDDAGRRTDAVTLSVPARSAAHFTSADLEAGNAERGLSGGVGEGEGDWRLELTSALDLEVLSYARTRGGGALASVHEVVHEDEAGHRVMFFNPASNASRVSWLRLINPGDEAAAVRISGVDDAGEAGESAVSSRLRPAPRAR